MWSPLLFFDDEPVYGGDRRPDRDFGVSYANEAVEHAAALACPDMQQVGLGVVSQCRDHITRAVERAFGTRLEQPPLILVDFGDLVRGGRGGRAAIGAWL